ACPPERVLGLNKTAVRSARVLNGRVRDGLRVSGLTLGGVPRGPLYDRGVPGMARVLLRACARHDQPSQLQTVTDQRDEPCRQAHRGRSVVGLRAVWLADTGCGAAWLARLSGGQEVPSSN